MVPPGSMGVHGFLRSSVPTLRSRVKSNVDQWHPSDSCPISGSVTCYSHDSQMVFQTGLADQDKEE